MPDEVLLPLSDFDGRRQKQLMWFGYCLPILRSQDPSRHSLTFKVGFHIMGQGWRMMNELSSPPFSIVRLIDPDLGRKTMSERWGWDITLFRSSLICQRMQNNKRRQGHGCAIYGLPHKTVELEMCWGWRNWGKVSVNVGTEWFLCSGWSGVPRKIDGYKRGFMVTMADGVIRSKVYFWCVCCLWQWNERFILNQQTLSDCRGCQRLINFVVVLLLMMTAFYLSIMLDWKSYRHGRCWMFFMQAAIASQSILLAQNASVTVIAALFPTNPPC